MRTFAVTGFRGKLGRLLCGRSNFIGMDCDVTDPISIDNSLETMRRNGVYPEIIVNCAAISSIDACEDDEKKANLVNVRGLYNLHTVFGKKVLNISSDHVFSSIGPFDESYRLTPSSSPVNYYGWSKLGAEKISMMDGGKTLRLSRSVSIEDGDISQYLMELYKGEEILVPNFIRRNYLPRDYIVNGIEYFVNNWDKMPQLVHYGAQDVSNFYEFMTILAKKFGLDANLVVPRTEYYDCMTPRPKGGGLKVDLSLRLGFPMYSVFDTCVKLAEDAHA